jgi:hypothetical protein
MATLKGKAVGWAVNGLAFTAGVVPSGTEVPLFQRVRAQQEIEGEAIIKGSDGKVATLVVPDVKKTITMTIIPSADTVAAYKTLMDKFYITPGTQMTITDSEGNIEGSFILINCGQERQVEGATAVDIELRNYSTDISATAS